MSQQSVFDQLKALIVEQLGVYPEHVEPHSKFTEDLGCDSLDVVELIMAGEDTFNMDIPDEDVEDFVTVDDVVKYIEKRLENASSTPES